MQTLKTFQIDSCPEIIWIKNLERKPENEIYDNVLGILYSDKNISIGKEIDRGLEFVRVCKYCDEVFEIVNDIDYGVMIRTQNSALRLKLVKLLEGRA